MPVLLVNFRGVPEDEAAEVRELLTENQIDFYETPPGNWGISSPGLWVKEQAEKDRALPLLEKYQAERAENARLIYQQRISSGEHKTFLASLTENSFRKFVYLVFIGVVLYFSIKPFLSLGH